MAKGYYHWCCEGLKNDLLFRDKTEFIAGMNRIAVCYAHCQANGRTVYIIAFCLLSNHFHFILWGEEEDQIYFMNHYRMLTTQWISRHRGERLHGEIATDHWAAVGEESIREKITYNLRQAVSAGLPLTPQGYPWCSGRLMFCDNSQLLESATPISSLSVRAVRRIASSKEELPQDWLVLPDGMIWPGCYTSVSTAEKAFSGVGDFMFMMNNRQLELKINAEIRRERPSIPDTEVLDRAREIAARLYGKPSVGRCSVDERIAVARILRKDFQCSHKQLARIVKMNEEDLRKLV